MSVRRQFRGTSGRVWSAHLFELPAGARAAVLRFETEGLTLELRDYPPDWFSLTDDALVDLARRANPPRLGMGPD